MQAYLGEFIGTMPVIILGDGVVAGILPRNTKAEITPQMGPEFARARAQGHQVHGVLHSARLLCGGVRHTLVLERALC